MCEKCQHAHDGELGPDPEIYTIKDQAALQRVAHRIRQADALLITAGAGMSAAAGLDYTSTELFAKEFPIMARKGHRCMYEFIGFSNWSPTEQWGYLARHCRLAMDWPLSPVYADVKTLADAVGDYFVMTSNVDGLFKRNGFDPDRVYEPQGQYCLLQCLSRCHEGTWDANPIFDNIIAHTDEVTGECDPSVVPQCPRCGGAVMMNVRGGSWFIEKPRQDQLARFRKWTEEHEDKKVVVLEIGAGFNTPSVIRWPSELYAATCPQGYFVRLNMQYPQTSDIIRTNESASKRYTSFKCLADEGLAVLAQQFRKNP